VETEGYSAAAATKRGKLLTMYLAENAPRTLRIDSMQSSLPYEVSRMDPTNWRTIHAGILVSGCRGKIARSTLGESSSSAKDSILIGKTKEERTPRNAVVN